MTQGVSRRRGRLACAGHSIIELIVAVTIASLVMGAALPSLRAALTRARLAGGSAALVADLALARTTAIMRGVPVTICQSRDGRQCTGAATWHEGWLVMVDRNGSRAVERPEDILHVSPPLTGATLVFNASGGGQHDSFLTYHPAGYTRKNGTFTVCAAGSPPRARRVIVALSGRARSTADNTRDAPAWCPPAL